MPGAIFGLVSFLLYFSGFRTMATSAREFSSPAFLTLIGLLGIALSVGGLALLLAGVGLASSSYALAPVAELFGVPLFLLGLVLCIVGFFGHAVGSWRAGIRYQEGRLRTGAVLMFIPLAGYGLSVLGYQRALARASSATPLASSA